MALMATNSNFNCKFHDSFNSNFKRCINGNCKQEEQKNFNSSFSANANENNNFNDSFIDSSDEGNFNGNTFFFNGIFKDNLVVSLGATDW